MIAKTIYKMGVITVLAGTLFTSCGNKSTESMVSEKRMTNTETTYSKDIGKDKTDLKMQAMAVINDFNKKANEIKVAAYKNGKNLDEDVKQTLIQTEEQLTQIQDMLNELDFQSTETWPEFSKTLHQELETVKANITNLSGKNIG